MPGRSVGYDHLIIILMKQFVKCEHRSPRSDEVPYAWSERGLRPFDHHSYEANCEM
jgi:hypothetical protein